MNTKDEAKIKITKKENFRAISHSSIAIVFRCADTALTIRGVTHVAHLTELLWLRHRFSTRPR